jgi:hypothetical protein
VSAPRSALLREFVGTLLLVLVIHELSGGKILVRSAGSAPASEINPAAVLLTDGEGS